MFCPQCSAENNAGMKYCCQCGFLLGLVQFALEGHFEKIAATLKKSESALRKGLYITSLSIFVAIASVVRGAPFEISIPTLSFSVQVTHWWVGFISALVIGFPVILLGLARLRRVNRRLLEVEKRRQSGNSQPSPLFSVLPPAPSTSPIDKNPRLGEEETQRISPLKR
jgi:hypothetical protein